MGKVLNNIKKFKNWLIRLPKHADYEEIKKQVSNSISKGVPEEQYLSIVTEEYKRNKQSTVDKNTFKRDLGFLIILPVIGFILLFKFNNTFFLLVIGSILLSAVYPFLIWITYTTSKMKKYGKYIFSLGLFYFLVHSYLYQIYIPENKELIIGQFTLKNMFIMLSFLAIAIAIILTYFGVRKLTVKKNKIDIDKYLHVFQLPNKIDVSTLLIILRKLYKSNTKNDFYMYYSNDLGDILDLGEYNRMSLVIKDEYLSYLIYTEDGISMQIDEYSMALDEEITFVISRIMNLNEVNIFSNKITRIIPSLHNTMFKQYATTKTLNIQKPIETIKGYKLQTIGLFLLVVFNIYGLIGFFISPEILPSNFNIVYPSINSVLSLFVAYLIFIGPKVNK